MNMAIKLAVLYFFFGCLNTAFAQSLPYYPVRIVEPIILDGKLTEAAWQQAEIISDFMQSDPYPGGIPSENTQCMMLYDDKYLYIGFRAYDSEVSKITDNSMQRDYFFYDDDGIGITIDSYNDKSTGVFYASNINSARKDKGIFQDGESDNNNFNTFWETKSNLNADNYTVEMRIPFSSLRFHATDKVVMGFRLVRFIKRKGEYLVYPKCDPNVQNPYFKVSLGREMVFEKLKSRTPFYISPYAIANYAENFSIKTDSTGYVQHSNFLQRKNYFKNETLDKIFSNIGIDAKYGLTKNSTLDLTLNTDFAQAEVDNRIINLTKYDVNLPERRNFFLESDDYFRFTTANYNELFISRSVGIENGQIVPIIGGARLTGIIGGIQVGLLDMQTMGVEEAGIQPHNFFTFRPLKRFDIKGSSIGAIFTNRWNTGTVRSSDQSIGIDLIKRITNQLIFKTHISTTLNDFKIENSGAKSFSGDISLTKFSNRGLFYDTYINYVGADFDPAMGFIDNNNYANAYAKCGYRLFAPEKNKVAFWYLYTTNTYRIFASTGKRETLGNSIWMGAAFKDYTNLNLNILNHAIDTLPFDWYLDEHNAISSGVYKMWNVTLNLNTPGTKDYLLDFTMTFGDFYGGKRLYMNPVFNYFISKHFSTDITYEYNNIHFKKYLDQEKTSVFNSSLIRISFSYLMSVRFSIKLFAQYDNLSRSIGSNLRFRYNPKEGTDLYIVVNRDTNSNRLRLDPRLPDFNGQAVTIKFIKTFGQ